MEKYHLNPFFIAKTSEIRNTIIGMTINSRKMPLPVSFTKYNGMQ